MYAVAKNRPLCYSSKGQVVEVIFLTLDKNKAKLILNESSSSSCSVTAGF